MPFLLLLPLLILLPSLGQFVYPPGSAFSDLVISHYPNAVFLLDSLKSGQGIPLWSPAILSGYPFAANPLSGLWYPPGWLALLFPLPLGFNLAVAAHLLWAGLGTYLWLRTVGIKPWAAVSGAIVFESLPKLLAHFAAGHLTLVYAVAWTPWLLLAETTWRRSGGWKHLWRAPGLVLGLILLADVRWGAYAAILWIAYQLWGNPLDSLEASPQSVMRVLHNSAPPPAHLPLRAPEAGPRFGEGSKRKWGVFAPKGGKNSPNLLFFSPFLRSLSTKGLDLLVQAGLALLIAAPLLLPLLEYTRLSSRSSLTPEEAFTLSLPPAKLLGLVFPDIGGNAEWVVYPGSLALVLAGVILFSRRLRRASRFWLWTALAALVFSLGTAIPFLPELARLPGFNLLRVPPRALLVSGFALAVLAAYGVDALSGRDPAKEFTARFAPTLFLVALVAFTTFLAAGVAILTGRLPFNFSWGMIGLLVTVLLVGLRLRGRMTEKAWWLGILVVAIVNPAVINYLSLDPRPVQNVLAEGEEAARFLQKEQQGGAGFRVYSPSYSLPQQTAARYQLQLADGVDPLQLAAYDRFMEKASGVPGQGYSVTLPPFASGDPQVDNRTYLPDPAQLGLLNVRYVVAAYDLEVPGLDLIQRFGDTRLYENRSVQPRAWRISAELKQGDPGVTLVRWQPDWIELNASGGGQLVLAEIAYPGWRAWVDGKETSIQAVDGVLRGLTLAQGPHLIVFRYEPASVYLGVGLAAAAWLVVISGWLTGRLRTRR